MDQWGVDDPFADKCIVLAHVFRDTGALPRQGGVLDQPSDLMVGIMMALRSINKREEMEQQKRQKEIKRKGK